MKTRDYRKLSNEELAVLAGQTDEMALAELLKKNRGYMKKKAGAYFKNARLMKLDYEDLLLEMEYCLYEAAKGYAPDRGAKFLTFAEAVIHNRMVDMIRDHYRKNKVEILLFLDQEDEDGMTGDAKGSAEGDSYIKELLENSDELIGTLFCEAERQIEYGQVEPQAVRTVFYEQFRDCFLKLPERQKQILQYQYGYDPDRPVLTCYGRELPDQLVAAHYRSKTSLIQRDKREAYGQIEKDFLGKAAGKQTRTMREPGRIIKEDFWIVHVDERGENNP